MTRTEAATTWNALLDADLASDIDIMRFGKVLRDTKSRLRNAERAYNRLPAALQTWCEAQHPHNATRRIAL